jgi:hypothetical protein
MAGLLPHACCEAIQHAQHVVRAIDQYRPISAVDEAESDCQVELYGKLGRRAKGDVKKAQELAITSSASALRNVAHDRYSRAAHLCRESVPLVCGEPSRSLIHSEGELTCDNRNVELPKIAHR